MKYELELNFTRVYLDHLSADPAIREAACLKALFPHLFQPLRPGDRFAGRIEYRPVGFGLELASGGPGFYCHTEQILPILPELSSEERSQVEAMIDFWKTEATIDGKLLGRLPGDLLQATSTTLAEMGGRLAGTLLDFDKLLRLGIPGLREEIEEAARRHTEPGVWTQPPLYRGMLSALDVLSSIMLEYAVQARGLAAQAGDEVSETEYLTMAAILEKLPLEKPQSFREAIQLFWLYALISGTVNYGRMDVFLGDFLTHDLERGWLTEAEALSLLQALWRMIAERKIIFNSRVFIGGLGRRNVINADRFAMLAMEATRTVIEVEPQLTLRIYQDMNPALMKKALDVIGEGRTFPMLFNDDVNVPAVMQGFNVARDAAEQYLPYGCGEYALDHLSFGSPNCGLNLLKALEATLHHGRDALTGERIGLDLGDVSGNWSFDDLWLAYQKQVDFHVRALADRHRLEYQAEAESAAFLFASMLYDDCIARGKSLVDGGTRYKGGVIETFGIVNTGDSLAVIKRLVYEQKAMSLVELVAILDANFTGFERQRLWMQQVSKYGNDDAYVDELVARVSDHVARSTHDQAARIGFDYFLVVNINNYANVTFGQQTAASAEGRRCGEPLANGNTPTAGNDRSGVTAFLNSIVKVSPLQHAGYTHNMKFNPSMFHADRAKLEMLLESYWLNGGTQAMITVVSRGDLEAALREPEKHRDLIVRVGGFSARFIELAPEVQADLIQRTLY
jgi:pyruvate-formate lyase